MDFPNPFTWSPSLRAELLAQLQQVEHPTSPTMPPVGNRERCVFKFLRSSFDSFANQAAPTSSTSSSDLLERDERHELLFEFLVSLFEDCCEYSLLKPKERRRFQQQKLAHGKQLSTVVSSLVLASARGAGFPSSSSSASSTGTGRGNNTGFKRKRADSGGASSSSSPLLSPFLESSPLGDLYERLNYSVNLPIEYLLRFVLALPKVVDNYLTLCGENLLSRPLLDELWIRVQFLLQELDAATFYWHSEYIALEN